MSSPTAPEASSAACPQVVLDRVSIGYKMPQEQLNSVKEYAIARLTGRLKVRHFWALNEVSLQIERGEVFGVVGRNGAGKTTLLKVIARVLRPTIGRVIVRGRVAPLLGLSPGFVPELTGRENVFLSGATLGFTKQDLQERFDRIVDFAGLRDFIDVPVRNYSTGMNARLGFAIATDVQPDILLLDEILAVGDAEFREKSEERISRYQERGTTTVLVSHSLGALRSLCDRVIWLHQGAMRSIGSASDILDEYTQTVSATSTTVASGNPAG